MNVVGPDDGGPFSSPNEDSGGTFGIVVGMSRYEY